jgi:hypothetical protein
MYQTRTNEPHNGESLTDPHVPNTNERTHKAFAPIARLDPPAGPANRLHRLYRAGVCDELHMFGTFT